MLTSVTLKAMSGSNKSANKVHGPKIPTIVLELMEDTVMIDRAQAADSCELNATGAAKDEPLTRSFMAAATL